MYLKFSYRSQLKLDVYLSCCKWTVFKLSYLLSLFFSNILSYLLESSPFRRICLRSLYFCEVIAFFLLGFSFWAVISFALLGYSAFLGVTIHLWHHIIQWISFYLYKTLLMMLTYIKSTTVLWMVYILFVQHALAW